MKGLQPEALLRLGRKDAMELLIAGKWRRTCIEGRTAAALHLTDPLEGEGSWSVGERLSARQATERGELRFWLSLRAAPPGPPPLLETGLPEEVRRLQRRSLFRLTVVALVRYRLAGQRQESLGRMRDLSGSGLSLVPVEPSLPAGTVLHLRVRLDNGADLFLEGQVVRQEPGRQGVGLRFLNPPPRTVDRIVAHLFREQRRRRQKGLL